MSAARHLRPRQTVLIMGLCALLLPACTGLRLANPAMASAATAQLRAPADWGELSRDVAHQISQKASQLSELKQATIYVSPPPQTTPFALALHQYLQSNLSLMGLQVAQQREVAQVVLEAQVQSITLSHSMQVVVTTSIGNGKRYLFRGTEAYIVDGRDASIYDAALLPVPPEPKIPTPTKTLRMTGKP